MADFQRPTARGLRVAASARWLGVGAALLCFTVTEAATLDDVGYTQLQAELGLATPTGAGVPVTQVEANQLMEPNYAYMPDASNGEFIGKSLTDASAQSTELSGHATPVGQLYYGNSLASARGITNITVYLADDWLTTGILRVQDGVPNAAQPVSSSRRVANHSWIGSYGSVANNTNTLRRVDWLVERDEYVQVVAYGAAPLSPLLSSAFNVISVDWTGALPTGGSAAVDATYTAGRTRPDVVAPTDSPSMATPVVASAAALLIGVGQSSSSLSTDLATISTTNRNLDVIYNASRAEVIKAALMAGADRQTHNSTGANITDYRANAVDQTSNGLDRRYGAGQVNVRNSYWIIAGGEKNSTEDGGPGSGSATRGFDYDPAFSGMNGASANYPLPVSATPQMLTASLVWNLDIDGGSAAHFNGAATNRDLALSVMDITNPASPVTVVTSQSTIDNTENAWIAVPAGGKYALRVTLGSGSVFNYDYALAWQLQPDTDADGVHNGMDNCIAVENNTGAGAQCDSDGDGYGNRCDGDLNNDGSTNAFDTPLFRAQLGQPSVGPTYNEADLDCNGAVNAFDTPLYRALLGSAPGPSGLACAGTIPCP